MSAFDYDFSVFDEIKNHLIGIKDSLVEIFTDEKLQNSFFMMVRQWSATLGAFVGTVTKIGAEIINGLVGGIDIYLDENKDYIKEKLINIFDIGGEIAGQLRKGLYAIADISDVFGSDEAKRLVANILGCIGTVQLEVHELALKIGRDIIGFIAQGIDENKDEIKETLRMTFEFDASIFGSLKTLLSDTFGHLNDVYDQKVKPAIDAISSSFSSLFGTLLSGYNKYMKPVMDGIAEKFDEVMNGNVGSFIEHTIDLIGNIIEYIKTLWKEYLEPIAQFVLEILAPVFAAAWDIICTKVLNSIDVIAGILDGIIQIFNGIIEFIVGIFSGDLEKAIDGLGKIWEGLKTIVANVWDDVYTNTREIWDKVKSHLLTIWEQVKQSGIDFAKAVWDGIVTRFNGLLEDAKRIWENIKNSIKEKWEQIKQDAINYLTQLVTNIVKSFTDARDKAITIVENLKGKMVEKWNEIKTNVITAVTAVKTKITEGFNDAKTKAIEIFEKIKTSIKEKIEFARDKVKEAIDKIKGFFNFEWSLPKIKLPHFTINGEFSLNPPKIPSFGVNWYRDGAVLPDGSNMIFGMNGNSLMAGGEYGTGGEAVLPLNTLFDEMKDMFDNQNKSLVKALSSNNSSSPITLTLNVDGTTLAKTTVKNMKDLSRIGALDLEWL